jgi:hypothetical protein
MTSKKLRKLLEAHFEYRIDVYRGHMMDGRYGWIVRPFGQNEIFLGRTLANAHEEVSHWEDGQGKTSD